VIDYLMPLSKKRNRERMRALRRKQRPHTISQRDVRAIKAAGLDVEDVVGEPPSEKVSGRVVNAIVRLLEAKKARVAWQSSGIRGLHDDIATLKAEMELFKSQLQTVESQRIAALSYKLAEIEVEHALLGVQQGID
jgi:uncharacterized coiled-coil protein SlyX